MPLTTQRYQTGILIAVTLVIGCSVFFSFQRNSVLLSSRNLDASIDPLANWVMTYPQDLEAHMALMSRLHYEQTHCDLDCAHWNKKSKDLADLWERKKPKIATGWLLTAEIAHHNNSLKKAKIYINRALALHPGMPQAWKFKLATFSHDPNYATWYKEASQWLHGTYQLKGLKRP